MTEIKHHKNNTQSVVGRGREGRGGSAVKQARGKIKTKVDMRQGTPSSGHLDKVRVRD